MIYPRYWSSEEEGWVYWFEATHRELADFYNFEGDVEYLFKTDGGVLMVGLKGEDKVCAKVIGWKYFEEGA